MHKLYAYMCVYMYVYMYINSSFFKGTVSYKMSLEGALLHWCGRNDDGSRPANEVSGPQMVALDAKMKCTKLNGTEQR